jgi:uncharacterized OB-fold protein
MNVAPCSNCGVQHGAIHEDHCSIHDSPLRRHLKQPPPLGWRCPVCGRGLAPHVSVCDCTTSLELLDCLSKLDVEHPPPEA